MMKKEKLKEVEKELQLLIASCKEQGMSEEEIRKLFSFVLRTRLLKLIITATILIMLVLLISLSFKVEKISWHLSALGRIAMVNLLGVYDWRGLKNSDGCLFEATKPKATNIECYFCEGLKSIPYAENASADFLKEAFLDLENPVIFNHNISNKIDLNEIFEAVVDDFDYSETIPCKLATNVFSRKSHTVYEILRKINRHSQFFAHFQNCDFDAVKLFRKIIPRPGFFVPEVSPIQYSWILASRNYDVDVFKKLQLSDNIAAVIQILGANTFILTPYKGCGKECKTLQGELYEGEVLLLTSRWDLAYKPDRAGENFAVILESH